MPNNSTDLQRGSVLVMMSWLTVMAAGLLSPVLPKIALQFSTEANLDFKLSFVATMPALAVAFLAFPIGRLGDRIGHRRVLILGLGVYGIAGVAPYWLDSLNAIIAARLVVGMGEAAAMTASIALIASGFSDVLRRRWLAIQVASANVVGVLTLFTGGFIGRLNWRAPFLIYSFAFFLLFLLLYFVRQSSDRGPASAAAVRLSDKERRTILLNCALLLPITLAIAVIIIQFGFLLTERGIHDPALLGLCIGCSASGIAIGASLAGIIAGLPSRHVLAAGYGLIGVGFISMALSSGVYHTVATGFLAGLGCGISIPVLLAATMAQSRESSLGAISGLWTSAVFIGQFLGPSVIVVLKRASGSLSGAIVIVGMAAAAIALGVELAGYGVARSASSIRR